MRTHTHSQDKEKEGLSVLNKMLVSHLFLSNTVICATNVSVAFPSSSRWDTPLFFLLDRSSFTSTHTNNNYTNNKKHIQNTLTVKVAVSIGLNNTLYIFKSSSESTQKYIDVIPEDISEHFQFPFLVKPLVWVAFPITPFLCNPTRRVRFYEAVFLAQGSSICSSKHIEKYL